MSAASVIAVLAVILIIAGVGGFVLLNNPTAQTTEQKGRVLFAVADDAVVDNSKNVFLTVNGVQVHSASEGWVTVSSPNQVLDLVNLKATGNRAVVADVSLFSDTYDQVKLDISNVIVIDANGTAHTAVLPSNSMFFNNTVTVKSNETSTVVLDINLDDSLHVAQGGQYVFIPVVLVQINEGAIVNIDNSQTVNVNIGTINNNGINVPTRVVYVPVNATGGTIVRNTTVSMNVNGTTAAGIQVPQNTQITIINNKIVIINSSVSFNQSINVGQNQNVNQTNVNGTMCAQDAMQCPDGSYVGRTGPNCQFICPNQTGNQTGNQTINQTGNQTGNQTINGNQTSFNLTASLSGSSEVPSTNSSGVGFVNVTIKNGMMTLTGSFSNLSSDVYSVSGSAAHIHFAPAGVNGPIAFPVTVTPGSATPGGSDRQGTLTLQVSLSASEIQSFRNGSMYVNVHTDAFPGGEIRGQLVVQ